MDVYVQKNKLFGDYLYVVYMDGQVIEKLFLYTHPPLSWSDQLDMARLYQEALEYWK